MFTGIVQAVGTIAAATPQGDGLRLAIDPGPLDIADVGIGDSIAVNGCCLTVVVRSPADAPPRLAFDVSGETLRCTTGLDGRSSVNLEKALRLADRLGGHLMTGHVDGVGTVVAFEAVGAVPAAAPGATPTSWRLEIEAPAALARFIAAKGSIAVQGVSLTVNAVAGDTLSLVVVPRTQKWSKLGKARVGARFNVEVDVLARYVERLLHPMSVPAPAYGTESSESGDSAWLTRLGKAGYL